MECLDGGASVSVNSTSSYNRVGSTCCYFSYEHNFRECRVIFICTVVLLKSMISLNLKLNIVKVLILCFNFSNE